MNIELTPRQTIYISSYKRDGTHSEWEVEGNIFYVKGMPAFLIMDNDEIDPMTPDGMVIYWDNREVCDAWLKKNHNITIMCDSDWLMSYKK